MNKPQTNNYARNLVTGEYLFFADSEAPKLSNPEFWAFFRAPRGAHAATFRGRLIGENPVSDSEAAATPAA